jgi:L-ribulose-5-phosphate 4-epimerase
MMLERLRQEVLAANLELVRQGLVAFTFGNASGISREHGMVAIKPSGVPYESMTPADIVVTDLVGKVVEGTLRPSSDLPTHLELYKAFPAIGGVVHTHSAAATAWAQAGRAIPCFGTTHADYFHGDVPVTAPLSHAAIAGDYERETGLAIARAFAGLDPSAMPAVLVVGHGPFTWGIDAAEAAYHAAILEYVARMATMTLGIDAATESIDRALLDRHFLRKHGPKAYYGQPAGAHASAK